MRDQLPVSGGVRDGLVQRVGWQRQPLEATIVAHALHQRRRQRRIHADRKIIDRLRDEMAVVRDGKLRVCVEHPLQQRGA